MNNSKNKTTKKLSISIGLILASFVYAFYQNAIPVSSVITYENNVSSSSTSVATPKTPATNPKPKKTPVAVKIPIPTPLPTPPPKRNGQYIDGTYTGSPADAYYGTIQVQAIIQNGALTDVQFLQYPNDRNTSIRINSQAMPILKQEAISAQSANVDIVSGATDSSQAFQQSLASALSQAA
jgi:uncharacterized protein with FMN-binding domain